MALDLTNPAFVVSRVVSRALTDDQFFGTNPTTSPDYERNLDFMLPRPGVEPPRGGARWLKRLIDHGIRVLPT